MHRLRLSYIRGLILELSQIFQIALAALDTSAEAFNSIHASADNLCKQFGPSSRPTKLSSTYLAIKMQLFL